MNWIDQGYLISKNRYNENSIIAEIFTSNYGKVTGIIFGATSKKIKSYLEILQSRSILLEEIKKELKEIKKEFAKPRKSEIIDREYEEVDDLKYIQKEDIVITISNNGYIKRTLLENYRAQNRGGKGVYTVKSTPKVGRLVSIMEVVEDDDIMIITNKGIMIRQPVENIKVIGRNTQGVKLLRLDDGAFISSITKVLNEDDDEAEEAQEETAASKE